jgi:hypothetical protein
VALSGASRNFELPLPPNARSEPPCAKEPFDFLIYCLAKHGPKGVNPHTCTDAFVLRSAMRLAVERALESGKMNGDAAQMARAFLNA